MSPGLRILCTVVCLGVALVGRGLLRSALDERAVSAGLDTSGITAIGKVTSVATVRIAAPDPRDPDSVFDEPTVGFSVEGRPFEVRARASRGDLHFAIGQTMAVIYPLGHPEAARIKSQLALNWQPMAAAGSLAIVVAIGLAAMLVIPHRRAGPAAREVSKRDDSKIS